MGFFDYYWQIIRGPWWLGAVGTMTTFGPLLIAALTNGDAWFWIALALLSLVVIQLVGFVLSYQEQKKRDASFPHRLEELLAKGMDEVRPPMEELRETSPGSGTFSMRDQGIDEALDYYEEARQLLISHQRRAYLSELAAAVNTERRRSRDVAEKQAKELERRSKKGEKVAAEQMDHFFRSDQRNALAFVDGTMEGLAAIGRQIA